jgi:hypothetical protein
MKEQQSINAESQEISLDKWGMLLMENILMTAAEALAARKEENSDSVEVTLKFRLTPIVSKDQLEVRVAFERDPHAHDLYTETILICFKKTLAAVETVPSAFINL